MLCIIPTLMVLSFFFNSRFLQTGILQTGPNQFVENQKQNQDNTGRFSMKNLPKRLENFFCRNFFAETSCSRHFCRPCDRRHIVAQMSGDEMSLTHCNNTKPTFLKNPNPKLFRYPNDPEKFQKQQRGGIECF